MTAHDNSTCWSEQSDQDAIALEDRLAHREALRDLRVTDLRACCALLRARIRRLEDAMVAEEAACLRDLMVILRRRR